jgi:hypothetical protein
MRLQESGRIRGDARSPKEEAKPVLMLQLVVVPREVLPARTLWLDIVFFIVVVNDCVIMMFCLYFG